MQPSQQPPIVLVNNPSSLTHRSRVHRRHDRSRSRSPSVVIHHDRSRVHEPPVIIQQPYGGTRGYEPQRPRSPPVTMQQPYPGPRYHDPPHPIPPPPGLLQQPYAGSRARESRRSRSPRRPIVIQQLYNDSSRSRVHERYHSSSPPPVAVQHPYTGSRVYDEQSSTNVAQSQAFPGTRPNYDRRGSRTPPIIIQQPDNGHGYYSRSPSPGHLWTSSYRDGSRRSNHVPPVIIAPRTPSPASSLVHHDRHAPIIVQLPPSSSSGTHYGHRHGEVYYEGQDPQDQSAFTAVDPFRPSVASSISFASHAQSYHRRHRRRRHSKPYPSSGGYPVYQVTRRAAWKTLILDSLVLIWTFLSDTLPRQIYLYFLLRLPAFYFSRVARIFEEADMTMAEIKGMAYDTLGPIAAPGSILPDWDRTIPALNSRLKNTWESFIDSLIMEWKTQNIVSVLLLSYVPPLAHAASALTSLFSSAILTILQIQSAADDPITRYAALLSLVCAMMSLLFGCMYIIRFGSMRKAYKAAEWAAVRLFLV